jgi:hypothetical protein
MHVNQSEKLWQNAPNLSACAALAGLDTAKIHLSIKKIWQNWPLADLIERFEINGPSRVHLAHINFAEKAAQGIAQNMRFS